MNCPNCGAKLPDDKLFCEKCGAELEIVTDYDLDVEVEKEMQKTLNNIKETEFPDEFDIEFDEDPNIISMIARGSTSGKFFYIMLALVFVVFIVGAVVIGKKINARNNYDFQIQLATERAASKDYKGAIDALESAYAIKPNSKVLFTIADYYYTDDRVNDSISTLMEIANGDFMPSDVESAYRKVLTLYIESGNYEKVADVLAGCENEVILSAFEDYMVFTPEPNYKEGTYEEALTLKFENKGTGTIYYTMDKSEPTVRSNVYDTPIFLDMGTYNVSAVYVNKFGVSSKPVSFKYLIDVEFVFEPTILTESGDYTEATLIEAELPVLYTLYYTTDGSDPDKTSKRYVSPIPMPEGTTKFKFVSYAPDGTQSSIIERTYKLEIELSYTASEAIYHLGLVLMDKGILLPNVPMKPGIPGMFLYYYSAIYPVADMGTFYFIVEYYQDENGNISNTNNVYAVNVTDLSTYKVSTSGSGEYILSDF